MCVENVTIALCAPHNPSQLSFNCSKLHMVAQGRTICKKARGSCICYFGTCGNVSREISTDGMDLSDVSKAKCASCTEREDAIGDSRKNKEVLESILLDRSAIDEAAWGEQFEHLSKLWYSKSTCPFHLGGPVPKDEVVKKPTKQHVWVEIDTKPVAGSAPTEASFVEVAIDEPALVEPTATDVSEHAEPDSGPVIDPWTGAPATAGNITAETAGFDSHSDKDGTTTSVTDENEGGASIETDKDSGKDVRNVLDGDVGIETSCWAPKSSEALVEAKEHDNEAQEAPGEDKAQSQEFQSVQANGANHLSRRAVNFSFSAETAEKRRDANEKLAALRSGFLSGKAY
ncbi:hypothetical protein FLONG3_2565 [Fusarium longipes]|uniref:Uncharacterized protein n=1 Tax=Fusarium longipes TaxID=694270 RepID=A0A395T4E2_9HYPO|nr:hypothetical protein FLONG3_2565 [Fusarium longipes]